MNPTVEATQSQPQKALPKFDNILLCTDFSAASEAATSVCVQLSKGREVRVTVVHVSEYGPMPATTDEGLDYVLGLFEKERRNLKSVADQMLQNDVQTESIMLEGNAVSNILDYIGQSNIDLAIVGTSAARGVERLLLGSTAESIFRRAPCPIITVGPGLTPAGVAQRGRPVIFATDFDDRSLNALPCAASLAEILGSRLHVVHVLPLTVRDDRGEVVPSIMGDALHLVTLRIPADGALPHCEILHGSDVSHAITEYAKAQNAAFIVLGVRSRSAIASHLPPQRTFRIVMTATCPVLTVASDPQPALATAAACF